MICRQPHDLFFDLPHAVILLLTLLADRLACVKNRMYGLSRAFDIQCIAYTFFHIE